MSGMCFAKRCERTLNFSGPTIVPTTAPLRALVAAELSGDKRLDLAAVGGVGNPVLALLGDGAGSFAATPLPYVGAPEGIAAGDLNSDGLIDLAVADPTGGVAVLLNTGAAKFKSAVSYFADHPRAIAIGDVNANLSVDLAVAEQGGNTGVLLGKGDGTFGAVAHLLAGSGSVMRVLAADCNGDKRADLVTSGSEVRLRLANPNGGWTLDTLVALLGNGAGQPIAAGDANSDGKVDLAVPLKGAVRLLTGDGKGEFTATVAQGSRMLGMAVAFADLDGDGRQDLLVADQSRAVEVWLGDGDGGFQLPVLEFLTAGALGDLVVGDWNGDGAPDLASTFVVGKTGGIAVMINRRK